MKANNLETVLYRTPTFSLLLVSHGGISSCMNIRVEIHTLSLIRRLKVTIICGYILTFDISADLQKKRKI